jgi:putative SOS response-associated peptidase YedK
MCFSVNVNLVKEELENRYGATLIDPDKYRPSYYYNAFALPELPAVCSGETDKIKLLKWGLIPCWTRSDEDADLMRFKTFNARSETVDKKKSFSSSFHSRRCLIPVRGFFEWQHADKKKIPWYIYRADNDILSLAGLYDEWTSTVSGSMIFTFTILTTDANELMAGIHNSAQRMPVVLDRYNERKWLDLNTSIPELKSMLKPVPSESLCAYTVSPLINNRNADRNTPEVIRPYTYNKENLLF